MITRPEPPVVGESYRAAGVRDIELGLPLPHLEPGADRMGESEWLLIRLHTQPLGILRLHLSEGFSRQDLAERIWQEFGEELVRHAFDDGTQVSAATLLGGLTNAAASRFLARRAEVLAAAPPITVVVCTRNQPESLRACLASVLRLEYPRFRVLVVDNAPENNRTREVTEEFSSTGLIRYLIAPIPGLSNARNEAIAAAQTDIVAFIDDDEIVDPFWLAEVARAFADYPEAVAVSGVIVPAALHNRAQLLFEEFGGHSKGRGFVRARFGPDTWDDQHPLYPLPPFGTGANMSFRREALTAIGGFDPALGAGTVAKAGEDTHAFTRLLLRGGSIVYQPTALTRHHHRADLAGLEQQLHGYGVGLTAFYCSLLRERPSLIWSLLRLLPRALRDLFGAGSARNSTLTAQFPRSVLRANLRGMLRGPLAYRRSRRDERRKRS